MAHKPDPARRPTTRPLSTKAIVVGGALLLSVAAVAVVALLWAFGHGSEADKARLDAIRTAASIVVGTGGAAALLLAARRQRATELDLLQKDHDSTERRVTELYTKAADQLGSDKAPVRLAGLYALERLAQDNPEHRQTIVNVICAYLRMPFTPPPDRPTTHGRGLGLRPRRPTITHTPPAPTASVKPTDQQQELQVRLTAQRILREHLRPYLHSETPTSEPTTGDNPKYWPNISLDLTKATLVDFDLGNCHVTEAHFVGAQFSGDVRFDSAEFSGDAWFADTQFSGDAWFADTQFSGDAWFAGAQFRGDAAFGSAQFSGDAAFGNAQFSRNVRFVGAQFSGDAWFGSAQFSGDAAFVGAQFSGDARFGSAQFRGDAAFGSAQFSRGAWFVGAQFSGDAAFGNAKFSRGVHLRQTTVELSSASVVNPTNAPQHWPLGWRVHTDHNGTGRLVRDTSAEPEPTT